MLDFTKNSRGDARITRAAPQRKPGQNDALSWDIDAAVEILDSVQAGELARLFPGIVDDYTRAKNKIDSSNRKKSPKNRGVKLDVYVDGNAVLEGVGAEIRYVKYGFTEDAQVVVARFRLPSVPLSDAGTVPGLLGNMVHVDMSFDQPELQLVTGGMGPDADEVPPIGALVTGLDGGTDTVMGRVLGGEPGAIEIANFRDRHVIPAALTSSVLVSVEEEDVDTLLEQYADAVEDAADMFQIMEAVELCAEQGNTQAPTASTVYLSTEVIARAIELATAAATPKPETKRNGRKAKA